jgi:prepilin-type N-terminal cleavage/methylation domain-containing protein
VTTHNQFDAFVGSDRGQGRLRSPAEPARCGFTLFELIVVMALLLLLAAVILPSVGAFRGDTRQRAAADTIRGELATARARAMEENKPYRVAVSQDRTRLRRAPDGPDFATTSASDGASGSATAVDYAFNSVTAEVVPEQDTTPQATDGWVTLATFRPDGTCCENSTLVAIKEDDRGGLYLRIRGITGSSRVVPNPASGNGSGNGGAK